jgi:hypothetical protein
VPNNVEFLLYPLNTGEDPVCLSSGKVMMIAGHEVTETKPDYFTFRCEKCGRSPRGDGLKAAWRRGRPDVSSDARVHRR